MPRLEYIDNAGQKSILNLREQQSVSIGRNPGSSIHTTNPSVSRNHGRIFFKAGNWLIKDLGSSNGTYVNDEPVQQRDLKADDRIRCGDFVISFFADGAAVKDTPRESDAKKKRTRSKTQSGGAEADPFAFGKDDFEERLDEDDKPRRTLRKSASPTQAKIPKQAEPVSDPREERRRRAEARRTGQQDEDPKPATEGRGRRSNREEEEEPPRRRSSRREAREDDEERPRRSSRRSSAEAQPERPSRSSRRRTEGDESRSGREQKLIDQIKEQATELETLSADSKDQKAMLRDLELKLEENESKATRYELELDSITEKYVQIKDQLTLSKERLDETREELAEKDDQVFSLESRLAELDAELESARSRATDGAELMSNFKIKLTHKDRQIEEIQRQYDLMDFEFRAVKEELRALQEGYNADSGESHKLERRINQLREIIADKENVISELRLEIENKDIEIRQVRMGMGMTDLEDEKGKLLQDYYEKNRECDTLRDEMKNIEHDRKELEVRLREIETELEKKSLAMADITRHPDYKAKVREAKRLAEKINDLQGDLSTAEDRLGEFSVEEKKRLQGEVAFFKRKSRTVEERLGKAQERITGLEGEVETVREEAAAAPPPAPEPVGVSEEEVEARLGEFKGGLSDDLEGVYEMFVQWRSNFSLFKTYLKEVTSAMEGLEGDDKDAAGEAMESVGDLLRVVDSDATALKRGLNKFKKKVG